MMQKDTSFQENSFVLNLESILQLWEKENLEMLEELAMDYLRQSSLLEQRICVSVPA